MYLIFNLNNFADLSDIMGRYNDTLVVEDIRCSHALILLSKMIPMQTLTPDTVYPHRFVGHLPTGQPQPASPPYHELPPQYSSNTATQPQASVYSIQIISGSLHEFLSRYILLTHSFWMLHHAWGYGSGIKCCSWQNYILATNRRIYSSPILV